MKLTRISTAGVLLSLIAGMGVAQTPAVPVAPAAAVAAPAAPKVAANGDIVQTLKLSGQFNTFTRALDATNLTGLLKAQPNLTVFAPNDAAFAALPAGELDRLMADKGRLQKLLTYHIVNARIDTAKYKGGHGSLPTVAGANVEIDGTGAVLMVNNAAIIQPDLIVSNGVVDVLDKVLNPAVPAPSAAVTPSAPGG